MTFTTRTRTRSGQTRLVMFVCAAAIALAACGDDGSTDAGNGTSTTTSSEPTPSTELSVDALEPSASCGDALFHFATPGADLALRVFIPGLLAEIEKTGPQADLTFSVDDISRMEVTLEAGRDLAAVACNDVAGDYESTGSWTATAATARVTAEEVPAGPLDECQTILPVSLELTNVVVPVDGTELTIPDLTLTGDIGWCAG